MSGARIRLILAAALFLGWMVWLALAVADKGSVVPVSRAQLTEATILVTAEVTAVEGKPNSKVKVVSRLTSTGPTDETEIDVMNLKDAVVPGKGFPGDGVYLLPLVARGGTGFDIAGLPRSPGYEATNPMHPVIYPWNEATRVQLKALGFGL